METRPHVNLKLTDEQFRRLKRVCKYRNLTQQSFALVPVMRAIEETEQEMRLAKERRTQRRPARDVDEPSGLGVRVRQQAKAESDEETHAPSSSPGQVVVNVGAPSSGSGGPDVVSILAAYVVAGPSYERDQRRRQAVAVLAASTQNLDERGALATRLEAAIAERLKAQPSDAAKLKAVATMTWDKLKGLLGP